MEHALKTAFDPSAPQSERLDAMTEAQAAAKPSSVPDLTELVKFVAAQHEENEFRKSLVKPNVIPFPSRAVTEKLPGMQSVWINDTYGNAMGEWRDRWSNVSFDMLRQMVDQTPVLGAVILTRVRQVKRFCRVADGGKGPGFHITLREQGAKMGPDEKKSAELLQQFFTHCGWERNPRQRARLRRDNFSNFMAKLVRDSLVLDSAPIETEYKRDRSLGLDGMYAVDGATIRLCNEVGYEGDDEIFALQVVDGQIRSAYTYDDLIYVPRNPRTDVLVAGYGMSECELLIRVITGYLNAFTYNTKFFDSNQIPKGLLHLVGDYGQEDLVAFRRYWKAMVAGIEGQWSLPVLVSKNQDSKAQFENFGIDVNEMMFTKWMTFLTAIICAIYGIAPDEINFESFTNGTSSLSGSDTEEKLINSKDKGLRPLLSHFEDTFSDYIVSEYGEKYVFRWTGLDEEEAQTRWDKAKTLLTWNEARKSELGMDAVPGKSGDAPLNPALQGVWQQENMAPPEDFGDPSGAQPPGTDDADGNEPVDQRGQQQGQDDDAGGDYPAFPKDAAGPDVQKSFGLPVFTVEP